VHVTSEIPTVVSDIPAAEELAPAGQGTALALPDEPVVRIHPSGRWTALNLKDFWAYRELFYFLVWRDLKVRYKQTLLGVAWVVIQPLLTMLVFAFVFGRVVGVPSDGVWYPLFAFSGLVPWTFFSSSVVRSGNSLVGSAHLITKVYFPRMILPAAAVAAGLVDLSISFLILGAMAAWLGISATPSLLMVPVLVLLTGMFALGIGMWASALNVKYRDVSAILPFLMQMGLFATPIIYPATIVPASWQWVLQINPMTGIIEGFRAAILGRSLNFSALGVSAAITVVLLIWSAYVFKGMEKEFADIV